MVLFSILFLVGILTLQFLTNLPSFSLVAIVIVFLIFQLLFFKPLTRYTKYLLPIVCGFAWALWYAHTQLAWTLPSEQEGKPLHVTGMITSIPDIKPQQAQFRFLLEKTRSTVQLTWKFPPKKLQVGDVWQLTIYLKKIKGLMNPASFDYEAWSYQEGLRAAGQVVGNDYVLLNSAWYHHPIDRLREQVRDRINEHLSKSPASIWITALAMGERQGMSAEDWKILRNTGTNHLIAIAGLHIGFLTAFVYTIVTWIWRRCPPLIFRMPAQQAGAVAALLMAFIYSAMAGFSLPTQRACVMVSFFLITLLLRRKIGPWQAWSLALFCVLLINPLSVLTASFWLSFISIALIIYGVRGRLAPVGLWWKHGRVQWVMTLGLVPLSVSLFQACSLVSFIANSIAIPCVGFIIIPLTFLGCFFLLISEQLSGALFWLASKVVSLLWIVLTYLAQLPWSAWYQFLPSIWYIITACIGILILLSPVGFPGKGLGIIWLLPFILYKPPAPPLGDVWFTLLDVGQGLSAVVQTHHHILVFDAGSRLSATRDMGETVVVPFLRSLSVTHIDRLVISHGDNDHIGGAFAILKAFPIYLVESSVPEKFLNVPASYCLRGETWQWDQVTFKFLYPTSDKLGLNNESSCVLHITNGTHSLLLTGDIENRAERDLTRFAPGELTADILVAPHHGSITSALDAFIQDVHPRLVLFPVGYHNRYHFPNPVVVQKYHNMGAFSYDTAQTGAIQLKLTRQVDVLLVPSLYRVNHQHYW